MAKPQDIMLDQDNELVIAHGDFSVDVSEAQNLDHLLLSVPGSMKGDPSVGIGVIRWVKRRRSITEFYTEAKAQLKADGWINESISQNGGNIEVSAERDE